MEQWLHAMAALVAQEEKRAKFLRGLAQLWKARGTRVIGNSS